jgi:SAM-dependent methyltransferase
MSVATGRTGVKVYLAHARSLVRFMKHSFGREHRDCPVCGYHGRFLSFGSPPRFDARCPSCGVLERQRFFVIEAERHGWLAGARVLHFAPEPSLSDWVRNHGRTSAYVTADLFQPADLKLNIEALDLADGSQDVILCSHVLEHVDDHKALREMHRVLRPGGIAMVMVPIVEGWDETYENAAITTPEQRALHFNQRDHVRFFGRDLRTRIRAAGFDLQEVTAHEPDVSRYSLSRGEKIFVCRKPGDDHAN